MRGLAIRVPDRNGDATPESIVYAWSGTPGTPLFRAVNDDDPSSLIGDVSDFAIQLLTRASTSAASAERELASFDTSVGASYKTTDINVNRQVAQYVKPAFASDVKSWSISRVRLLLSSHGPATGRLKVSLVESLDWKPTGKVLASVSINETSLPTSLAYVEIIIGAGPLPPTQGVFIKVQDGGAGGTNCAVVGWGSGGVTMPYNTFMSTSTDVGATWSAPQDTEDMRFTAWGTVSN